MHKQRWCLVLLLPVAARRLCFLEFRGRHRFVVASRFVDITKPRPPAGLLPWSLEVHRSPSLPIQFLFWPLLELRFRSLSITQSQRRGAHCDVDNPHLIASIIPAVFHFESGPLSWLLAGPLQIWNLVTVRALRTRPKASASAAS
jgi:hypothetical protein